MFLQKKFSGEKELSKYKQIKADRIARRRIFHEIIRKRDQKPGKEEKLSNMFVMTYEMTSAIHEVLEQHIKENLEEEGRIAHRVFPNCLQQLFPKWQVSRMLDKYVQ